MSEVPTRGKCEDCGKYYNPRQGNQRFCSRTCGDRSRSRKHWRTSCRTRKYGLTVEQVEGMFESQGGRCAACAVELEPQGTTRTSMAIDHSHDSGKARAILCRNCNTALGLLEDSPFRVSALLEYIGRYSCV